MLQEVRQIAQRAITRLNNILCRGVLNSVTSGKVPVAKVSLLDQEIYDEIEFANDWGFISSPPKDGTTETLVAFLGGQRDQGTVLKSFNREFSFKNKNNIDLEEGETAFFNKTTGTYIHLKANGSIEIKSTSTSVTIDSPEVTITGNLTVNGDVLDNATGAHINTNTIREMREIYDEHVHPGVEPGGGSTQPTTEQM